MVVLRNDLASEMLFESAMSAPLLAKICEFDKPDDDEQHQLNAALFRTRNMRSL